MMWIDILALAFISVAALAGPIMFLQWLLDRLDARRYKQFEAKEAKQKEERRLRIVK